MGIVHSSNEWGQLKEVIVGRVENFRVPPNEITVKQTVPSSLSKIISHQGGQPLPAALIEKADSEICNFIKILESLNVKVSRPEIPSNNDIIQTPFWTSTPLGCACVRDGTLIVGNKIIEAPMSWRSRYNELLALRRLFNSYSHTGAVWISAPKPFLLDSLYNYDFIPNKEGEALQYIINETEIVFDAADFTRCDKEIFCQLSHTTNLAGIRWLETTLGEEYTVHILEQKCLSPLHIDCTFVPIGSRRALINPKYIDSHTLPESVKREWEIITAPVPILVKTEFSDFNMCSENLAFNLLMINPNLAIVDEEQIPLINVLESIGIECIGASCKYLSPFGGSFHCFTLDIFREEI